MINLIGNVKTLYQGACDLAYVEPSPGIPFDLKLKTLICYRNWKKTFGEPSSHYYTSEDLDSY